MKGKRKDHFPFLFLKSKGNLSQSLTYDNTHVLDGTRHTRSSKLLNEELEVTALTAR